MGIEATRDEHPVRGESIDHGLGNLVESTADHVTGGPGWEGDVDREPQAIGTADLFGPARTWEERPLVGRDVQHVGVVPEDGLCAVAVMNVPVHDEDPMSLGRQRRRADGDVVEQAEPHGAVALGMVTWWSHRNKGDPIASAFERSDGFEARSGGPTGRAERVRLGVRVRVEVASALITESFEFGQVLGSSAPEPDLRLRLSGD